MTDTGRYNQERPERKGEYEDPKEKRAEPETTITSRGFGQGEWAILAAFLLSVAAYLGIAGYSALAYKRHSDDELSFVPGLKAKLNFVGNTTSEPLVASVAKSASRDQS